MGIKRQKRIRSVIIGIFSIILAAVILAPLWLFISSIANLQELLKIPLRWLPEKPSFERYREILFLKDQKVSSEKPCGIVFIAAFVTIICVSLGSLAAYAFSRLRFPGKEKSFSSYFFLYATAYCGDNSYLSDF